MNPTQFYLSVAVMPVTTMIIVLIGVLLNNNTVNNRMNDLKDLIRAQGDVIRAQGDVIQASSDRQDANLRRVEDMLLGKFAELDNRLSRIEGHLNLH
jgi:hypothetical protein